MIRVAIVAASEIVRAGLTTLIRSSADMEPVVGLEAGQFEVLLAEIDQPDPDSLPDLLDLAERQQAAVVLLAEAAEERWIAEALRLGVRAILPRESGAAEIIAAVASAAAGLIVLHPQSLPAIMPAASSAAAPAPLAEELSAREIEVLRLMAEGLSNKLIAWRLGISEHTVKFHAGSILAELNAASRTEAVTAGIRRGLILL